MNRGMIAVLSLSVLSLVGCSSSISTTLESSSQARAQLKQNAVVLSTDESSTAVHTRHGRSAMARERILK